MPVYMFIVGAAVLYLISGIRIAREYERIIVFRFGRFHSTRGPGLFWVLPYIEKTVKVDIRTNTVDVERQEAITRDSVTVKVNAVLWYRVESPEKAILQVNNYRSAVYQVAMTGLRNIIGQYQLDEVLKEREEINTTLKQIVDKATDPWGIKVEMIEMKDVEMPESMQRAMAREAEASRERAARIIKASAELEASEKLVQASRQIASSPASLELRRLQTIAEVGAEHNSTTIILIPSDFLALARDISTAITKDKETKEKVEA